MNVITRRTVRTSIAVLVVGAIAVAQAGPAFGSHVLVRTEIPGDLTVGEMAHIPVALQAADRAPLSGVTVVFYLHAAFAGVAGEVEIGRGVTDEAGVATLAYRPRLAGHHELRVAYTAPDESEVEVVSTVFDVSGGRQLFRPDPGIEVPGLNVGLLMAVLTTVWSILFWVALRLVAIARAGGEAGTRGLDQPR